MKYDKIVTTKEFTIWFFDNNKRGYFEHNKLGEDHGGGLWFEGDTLVDYDGVFDLPEEIQQALMKEGFLVV